jgi:hypothetical protein
MKHLLLHRSRALRGLILAGVFAIALCEPCSAETGSLEPHLEPLRGWLGKTWKEHPKEGAANGKIDIRMQGLLPADSTQRVDAPAPLGVMLLASVVFSVAADGLPPRLRAETPTGRPSSWR